MRKVFYHPDVSVELLDLTATPDEIDMINKIAKELAAGKKKGYRVPFKGLPIEPDEGLYQYQVGRFKLNYTLSSSEVYVVSVMV